tara:strand:- start:1381 stop:2661 length:1281 start_codon:yes stop_codon:yes gene_type:complete
MKASPEYFNRNTLFSGLFFFFVLFSLFVMRPFRGVITAQIGTADLTYFLIIVVFVMLIVNLIYSALVSRIRESKLVLVVYGFFVLNLLVFSYLNYYFPESYLLSGSFYVWYNVFNFSVVSVFWARTINSFNYEDGKKYFGIISAFGSAGGFAASQLVLYFLKDEFIFTMILSCMSLILAVYFSTQTSVIKENSSTTHRNNLLDDASEQFKQIKSNVLVRQLLSYVFVWTCLSTALYFFSLEVINAATTKKLFVNLVFVDRSMQAELFALADSIAIPLTLFTQVFLTRFLLQSKFFGIKFVLIFYGAVYAIGFLLMYIYFSQLFLIGSGALVFLIITALVRPYEYAVNKPARETVYTTLEKTEKYKSTVFIDTFMNRFGDASGGLLFNLLLVLGFTISAAPLAIIPLAAYLSLMGNKISSGIKKVNN